MVGKISNRSGHRPARSGYRWYGRAAVAVIGAGLAVSLAACGSSSSAGSSSGSSGGTAANATGTEKQVAAVVQQLEQRPTSIGITQPVGAAIPKGKTIDFLECGAAQCAYLGSLLQSAAAVLGWTVHPVQAGLTPSTIQAAYQEAVRDHPSAVVEAVFTRQEAGSAIAAFSSAKIPYIELAVTDAAGSGITGVIYNAAAYQQMGKEMAEYVFADSGGKTNTKVAVGTASVFQISISTYDGFVAEYKSLCPSCSVVQLQIPASDIGQAGQAGQVALYFRSHPGTGYYIASTVDLETGVYTALQQAGVTGTKIIVGDTNATVLQQIQSGQVAAAAGVPWPENMWRTADLLARAFTGKSYGVDETAPYPQMIITKSNEPSATQNSPLVAGYQSAYKALWGISS